MNAVWIGWSASAIPIPIATLARQVVKQSDASDSLGVSKRLFAGRCAASTGVVVHSLLAGNGVFIVTDRGVLPTAAIGQVRTRTRRRAR